MLHCGSDCENRNVSAPLLSNRAETGQSHIMAVVAVEYEIPGVPPVTTLDRATASVLADALALDLAAHVPEIRGLDFVFVGALYDQAQLLRPRWPVHVALSDALERLPRGSDNAHVIALGAHKGRLPLASLEPDRDLLGSPMLVMPWLLSGKTGTIDTVGRRLEHELLERGLIGAELALAIGEAFGIKTTHARHLTTLDLAALASAQYEHADLGGLWEVIEAALLEPDREQIAGLPDGSTLRYHAGVIECDSSDRRRLAQCRAILAAHGIEMIARGARH